MIVGLALLLRACGGQPPAVVELVAANFDAFIREFRQSAVLFYAPWEEDSQKLNDIFLAAVQKLSAEPHALAFGRVDIATEAELAEVNHISLFPVIKLFYEGQPTTLPDAEDEARLIRLLRMRKKPPTKLLYGDNEFDELERYPVALLFVLPEEDAATLEAVHALLADYRELYATHTHDYARVPEHRGGERFVLKAYRLFDEGNQLFVADAFDAAAVRAFIDRVRHPNVVYFDQESVKRVFTKRANAMVLFTADPSSPQVRAFEALAKAHKGRIIFAVAYSDYGVGERLARMLGVAKGEAAALRVVQFEPAGVKKFICADVQPSAFLACLEEFERGALPLYLRSDPLPAEEEGGLRTVVSLNFEAVVLRRSKHLLLLLYEEFCPQCERLFAILRQAMGLLKPGDAVIFARLEAVRNEVSGLQYESLPALSLYRLGEESPRDVMLPDSARALVESLGRELDLDLSGLAYGDAARPLSEEI